LPHVLLIPFVRVDSWWYSGIASAFPSAAWFVMGGMFLFAASRRIFRSTTAAVASTMLAALNPNLLYLQSTSMTEAIFFGALMALLYFSVRFRETQGWLSVAAAGIAAGAGTLTRYDGWFLLPIAAASFFFAAKRRRVGVALLFTLLAGLGPLYWLAHNWYLSSDPLFFYRGPYSAAAIQGNAFYPGKQDWRMAFLYFRTAVQLCAGPALAVMALAGAVVALARRAFWPLLLLALPGVFYVWSLHSSGTPIFVPTLWPHSYYNTRYGLAALPLLAFAAGALVTVVPQRFGGLAAAIIIVAGTIPWVMYPRPETWITWAESRANSTGRRAWMCKAADYLRPLFVPGSGIITASGDDFSGIYRQMRIPLRETFSVSNGLPWEATVRRPELYLWQEWAVVKHGDPVQLAIERAANFGIRYRLEKTIIEKDEPVIEIYRRVGGLHGPS
jgi:4-amino-4-deoxy-L-arabinose transferase-like glycosyltransferase